MTSTQLRVLAVAASPPFPPEEARALRSWHLLRRLAPEVEVVLLTWADADTPHEDLAPLREAVHELVVLPTSPARRGLAARLARQARFLAGGWVPPYAQELLEERGLDRGEGRRGLEEAVRARHAVRPFDLVVLEEDAVGCAPLPDLGVPRVQHRLNLFAPTVAALRHRSPLLALTWPLQAAAWRRYDRRLTARAGACVTVTPEAATALRRLAPSVPVVTIPNGTDRRRLETPPSEGTDVAFVGWMRNAPNADAARFLAERLWPPLARRFPGSRLRLVGRDPPPWLRRLATDRVVVTGEVPDVVAACEGVRVGVVPLRSGMGIKNKTLELMAMGLPVVATPLGAEGVEARTEDGLLVAGDEQGLVEAMSTLLADAEAARRLGAAARRFVETRYGWDGIARDYAVALAELVRKVPAGATANPTSMASASGTAEPRARPSPTGAEPGGAQRRR